jgi:hypothetical protein
MRSVTKKLAVLFSFTAIPLTSWACEMNELVFLAKDDTLHYEFIQTKNIAALSQPLVSNGVLGLSSRQELVWQTLKPLKSTLVIGVDGLKQFNRNDKLVNDVDNPIAAELAQVFLSMLSGNTEALDEVFTQTLTCENTNWHLSLVPKEEDLQNMLDSLTMNGAERIEKISFRETRGDYTEILVSAPLAGPVENLATFLGD